MPKYRAYQMDKEGRVIGLPDIITCNDDETAIKRAKLIVNGDQVDQARRATSGRSLVTDRLVPAVHRMWRSRFCEPRLRTIAEALKEQI
jgi:hypothetical protein